LTVYRSVILQISYFTDQLFTDQLFYRSVILQISYLQISYLQISYLQISYITCVTYLMCVAQLYYIFNYLWAKPFTWYLRIRGSKCL